MKMAFRRADKRQTGKHKGVTKHAPSKTNKWGQASGGWSPFATSAPAKGSPGRQAICESCGNAGVYDAYDRVAGQWFTFECHDC